MPTVKSIPVAELMLDTDNFRLENPLDGQRELVRAIARQQQDKLVELASDIVEYGLNPSDRPFVVKSPDEGGRYVVLEGNRRISALRILEAPDIVAGAVPGKLDQKYRALSQRYLDEPIGEVDCVVFDSEEEADHWRYLRHTGENSGKGIVRWGASEIARFRRHRGEKDYPLQALEFLVARGELTPEDRSGFPITSLRRLLSNPQIRQKFGLEMSRGVLYTGYDVNEVARGLGYVARDLASGNVRTGQIYNVEDRLGYIASLDPSRFPDTTVPAGELHTLEEASSTSTTGASPAKSTPRRGKPDGRKRTKLIPRECILVVTVQRINSIYYELKRLNIDEFPNAAAVLFRVFLELSVDAYSSATHLGISEKDDLRRKLELVANHLKSEGRLTDHEHRAVHRAAAPDTFLAASIVTLHQYVHNAHFIPTPADLRAAWDQLQPFVIALWS